MGFSTIDIKTSAMPKNAKIPVHLNSSDSSLIVGSLDPTKISKIHIDTEGFKSIKSGSNTWYQLNSAMHDSIDFSNTSYKNKYSSCLLYICISDRYVKSVNPNFEIPDDVDDTTSNYIQCEFKESTFFDQNACDLYFTVKDTTRALSGGIFTSSTKNKKYFYIDVNDSIQQDNSVFYRLVDYYQIPSVYRDKSYSQHADNLDEYVTRLHNNYSATNVEKIYVKIDFNSLVRPQSNTLNTIIYSRNLSSPSDEEIEQSQALFLETAKTTPITSPVVENNTTTSTQSQRTREQNINTPTTTTQVSQTVVDEISTFKYSQEFDDQITRFLTENRTRDAVKDNTRIFGHPFQFTNIADYRPFAENDVNFGRKYLENIILEAPVVYFCPGLPDYMPDADKETKEKIDAYIKTRGEDVSGEILDSVLGEDIRYFGFVSAYAEYIRYVNLLCRACAIYMGIGDKKVPPPHSDYTYSTFDWGRYSNLNYTEPKAENKSGIFEKIASVADSLKDKIVDELFGDYRFLKLYVDPSGNVNESGSNSTSASQIAGLFDQIEGIVKEIGFFSNGSFLDSMVSGASEGISSILNGATGALDSNSSAGLSKIIGNASHVLTGSNVIFPELWSGSDYSKSYSFNINLISPYGDKESIYLNIIVPMMHIIAISMPRQTSANSFGSPFLVKLFSKGWFTCELGIVESIQIEKNPESWTVDGFPTEVKISLNVKDLYPNLMISKSTAPTLFFSNQGLIEFLAVTCGVNLTTADIGLKIETILKTLTNTITDIPSSMYDTALESIRNAIEPWFKITR